MKRITIALVAVLMLAACDDTDPGSQRDVTSKYNLPESMKDCKIYYMSGSSSVREITVIRCPNSSTAANTVVSSGKSTRIDAVVVIDGVQYELTPKE